MRETHGFWDHFDFRCCAGIWHHVGLSFENYEASKGEFVEALKPLGIRITLDMAEESACSMDLRDDSYEFWLSKGIALPPLN